jgi:phenylalanyl-tRNA synthetase alpha chain
VPSRNAENSVPEMAEEAILGYLAKNKEIADSGEFAAKHGLDHDDVVNVIKSLHGFRYVDAQVLKSYSAFLCN